jgi:flavin reductase (DIM6/NTAB) family NADH-FMN oxidoreductase RutF
METTSRRPSIGPEEFRGFMSAYFTGVAVVTSTDGQNVPHGLTCNSLTSVTLSPPTLLVCLDVRSGTLAAVRAQAGFVVNLLHDRGRRAAEVFSSPEPERFARVIWQPSVRMGLPWLLDDAYAMAECAVTDLVAVGDHVLVLGRVINVDSRPGSPLLYGRRAFGHVTG